MLLYPPLADLLKNVENKYLLVNAVARRARQVSDANERDNLVVDEKNVRTAIDEIYDGKIDIAIKEELR